MTTGDWVTAALGVLSYIWLPVLVDFVPAYRARLSRGFPVIDDTGGVCHDFAVIVPIYGDIRYLVNVDYLARYGSRVFLATTSGESDQFNADVDALADRYGFQVVRATVSAASSGTGKRATAAPIRDAIVREAVRRVTARYVVCLDADSFPEYGFEYLFGAMRAHDYDVASVQLRVSNPTESVWTRLQTFEYGLAMTLRRVLPWLVSGACHAATTDAYRQIMEQHSMFFQGNDVEVGLLAERLNYHVGHLAYPVGTEVPDRVRPLWRQRYAWAGGEWRLAIRNVKYAVVHPWFYLYVTVIMIVMLPIRWYFLLLNPSILLWVLLIYFALVSVLAGRRWRPIVALYPLYTMVNSLVIVATGGLAYVCMSVKYRNWGGIALRPHRRLYDQPTVGAEPVIDVTTQSLTLPSVADPVAERQR